MTGYLNMTFNEVRNKEATSVSVKCKLQNVANVDKFMIVHQVLKALCFTEEERYMLSIAARVNHWPDSDEEEILK